MRLLLVTLLAALPCSAQVSPVASGAFDTKNVEALQAFRNGDYDTALRLTNEALQIGIQTFGPESAEVAVVQSNLGAIYRLKEKFTESIERFEESIRILKPLGKTFAKQMIRTYEALGVSYRLAGKSVEGEKAYRTAIDLAETTFGNESFEMFSPTFSLAKHYAITGFLPRADDYYIKAYRIVYLRRGKKAPELDEIEDSRTCLVFPQEISSLGRSYFLETLKAVRESIDGPAETHTDEVKSSTVLNGRALSLPKPEYPSSMSIKGRYGAVVVRVLIDIDGTVSRATASCGHPDFAKPAVKSALKAKFSPTLSNGQPVKVSGVIVYNFVGRTR